MRRAIALLGVLGTALLLAFSLAGCPTPASYGSTITPVYAATNSGLYVFNGSSWKNYTYANTGGGLASDDVSSVVVSGSGSGAAVFAATADSGISMFDGSTWQTWTVGTDGLGGNAVSDLFLGSANLYAATSGGLSIRNYSNYSAAKPWTNDGTVAGGSPVTCVYPYGTYTYVGSSAGLFVYNGTSTAPLFTFTPSSIVPSSTTISAIIVDSSQDIIAATDKGLNVLYSNATPFAFTANNQILSGTAVHGLYLDASNNLYAASDSGLYEATSKSQGKILGATAVYCVYVDGAGTIYAGTATGLEVSKDGGSSWANSPWSAKVNGVVTTAPLYSF